MKMKNEKVVILHAEPPQCQICRSDNELLELVAAVQGILKYIGIHKKYAVVHCAVELKDVRLETVPSLRVARVLFQLLVQNEPFLEMHPKPIGPSHAC